MAAHLEHRRRGRPKAEADQNYDGSTPLTAPRREVFCCYAARISNLTDAYIAAGYTCASRAVASRNGSRLRAREPGIRERITYLAALSDEAFESAFDEAKARVAALDQSGLEADRNFLLSADSKSIDVSNIAPHDSKDGKPAVEAELTGTREVLEYVVRMSRVLNERAKELELGANIRKRILALHSAATLRLLEKLNRLVLADRITAETEKRKRESTKNTSAAFVRRGLAEVRNNPCTCGEPNVS